MLFFILLFLHGDNTLTDEEPTSNIVSSIILSLWSVIWLRFTRVYSKIAFHVAFGVLYE